MSAPVVSVIVPADDTEATILETLASARAQTHTDLEILVTDRPFAVVPRYQILHRVWPGSTSSNVEGSESACLHAIGARR